MKISDLFETDGGEQAEHDSRSLLCTCAASKGQPHSRKCPQYRKPIQKEGKLWHFEVNYKDSDGSESFTVIAATSTEDAKKKFREKCRQKGIVGRKITSTRGTGHPHRPQSKTIKEAGPEWIKHPTAKGVMVKNPRWEPPMSAAKPKSGLSRSEAMKKRHADQAAKLDKLYWKISAAISETFPDGDPWDESSAWAKRIFNLDDWADTGKYINAAVKKHESYATLSDWLAGMWDEYQRDSVSDAKHGHVDNSNPFYRVGENGEIEPEQNPWR